MKSKNFNELSFIPLIVILTLALSCGILSLLFWSDNKDIINISNIEDFKSNPEKFNFDNIFFNP